MDAQQFTARSLYDLSSTATNNGVLRKKLVFTAAQKLQYIDDYLLSNDVGYGQHNCGNNDYSNKDCRGRGLLHLTFLRLIKNVRMRLV